MAFDYQNSKSNRKLVDQDLSKQKVKHNYLLPVTDLNLHML